MKRIILMQLCLGLILIFNVQAATESTLTDQSSVEVTVYNSNIGLVKDQRKINLSLGTGELRFMDVAAFIQPETVHIKELNKPSKFMVLEQNYEYDLISYQKILEKNVGGEIKLREYNVYTERENIVKAKLLSYNSMQAVYLIDEEIHLGYPGTPIITKMPDNLISKPTLTWLYDNQIGRALDLEATYLTGNINWKADYVLVVDQQDTAGDLSAWVTIDNQSGATYTNAKLKVVAGDVNRVQNSSHLRQEMKKSMAYLAAADRGFSEEKFFEYHIYDLARPTTIKNNQQKQINLLSVDGIKVNKEYVVIGQPYYYIGRYQNTNDLKTPVNVVMKFHNAEANRLGQPLPMGAVRLYKKDNTGSLQFIGEDQIKHTPKDEMVMLQVGDAFDIVAERKQVDYKVISSNLHESEWQVELRNHKDEDILVSVVEPMQYDWEIINANMNYEKTGAFTLKFNVPVAKNGTTVLKYRVRVDSR